MICSRPFQEELDLNKSVKGTKNSGLRCSQEKNNWKSYLKLFF